MSLRLCILLQRTSVSGQFTLFPWLITRFLSVDKPCPLLSPIDHAPLGNATIFYSCTLHHDGRPAVKLTTPALQNLVRGEDAIPEMTTPGDAGLATALSFASSDVTQNILSILTKIDKVGQIITEVSRRCVCQTRVSNVPQVHPYAKLAWIVLNAAQRVRNLLDNLIWVFILPQVVAAQIDRDDRVRRLWNRIGDILDLVNPLGKYKDHQLYKKNVEAILKQVYECVLFLRWYADKGFAGILYFLCTQALHSYELPSSLASRRAF
jgi:hypothetical protein